MKITIEITEEDAACLWDNCHRIETVEQIIQREAKREALVYREAFPFSAEKAVEDFRKAFPSTP